jgi:hypothetical protein
VLLDIAAAAFGLEPDEMLAKVSRSITLPGDDLPKLVQQ